MLVLGQEVQKLCAYQGEGEIPASAVEKLCIRQLDANVFDLARRILPKTSPARWKICRNCLTWAVNRWLFWAR